MGFFDTVKGKLETIGQKVGIIKSDEEKCFNQQKNVYDFIVKAGKITNFKAIKDFENKILFVYLDSKQYTFRKNDQIIDQSDISYFVQGVDNNFKLPIKFDGGEIEITVQKITYSEKPMLLPSYINNSNINSVINITAENSNFGDIGTFLTTQKIDYKQVLSDLNNVVESSYHVEELRKMMEEIRENIKKNEPIKESKIKRFFKYMGTQAVDLAKLLIVAYATAKL